MTAMGTYRLYKIICVPTEMSYVGVTKLRLARRWSVHLADAMKHKGCRELSRAIREFGKDAFVIEEICTVMSRSQADSLERAYIRHFGTRWPDGYNLFSGGNRGFDMLPETRARIGASKVGKARPDMAKLSVDQVVEMRALHKTGTVTETALARMFGVSIGNVSHIVRGLTWRHVPI
jgi:group I intron endonuclease